MSERRCPSCGAGISFSESSCKYCGEEFPQGQTVPPVNQAYQQPGGNNVYGQPPVNNVYINQAGSGIDPSWPIKNKVAAGLLAIFLGDLGIHKFYLGKIGMGILYIIFCWTFIPGVVGVVEGIIYLCSNDHNFQVKHRVRLE